MEEREFELVNIIGANLASSQRDLSRHMDLSLGMTNMLIRRIVTKGYIRINQLDKKKVQYILTPKGFAEKMQKSVKYTMKTLNSIGLMKSRLLVLLKSAYDGGVRKFYVLGGMDLAGLIEIDDAQVGGALDGAFVGGEFAGENPQQRRFARAVQAEQAEARAGR